MTVQRANAVLGAVQNRARGRSLFPPTGVISIFPFRPTILGIFACLTLALAVSAAETDQGKQHWSFVPPNPVISPPIVKGANSANPIDAFILAKLRAIGIKQVEPATKSERLRRVTYDLTGLPPTPAEMKAFLADHSPHAWEKVIDRLLASSAFGERWAQHWLDLAHYADSNGFELDADRPDSWRYRDWVINAINGDMPYDRFLTLQIAGDEVAPGDHEALIASGFSRAGPREVVGGNIDPEVRRQSELTEATSTVGSVFLGLTMGCARCHDHKFDPITTSDYYSLEAFFSGTQLRDLPINSAADKPGYDHAIEQIAARIKPLKEAQDKLESPYRARIRREKEEALTPREREVRAKRAEERTPEETRLFEGTSVALSVKWEEVAAEVARNPVDFKARESLKRQIYEIERDTPRPLAAAMSMSEEVAQRPATWILKRGNVKNKRRTVEAEPPEFLLASMGGAGAFHAPTAPIDGTHSGWRLALAHWFTATNNPLTARVIVNRIWQHHFGVGLVATPSDFGTRGEAPANQALLDYLADELVRNGWHLKPIHRLILSSKTYQLASNERDPVGVVKDPSNRYLWRMNRRRMEAEGLRDSMLAVSGQLNRKAGGPGVLIDLEPEVRSLIFSEQETVELWQEDADARERCRRSIYVYRKRNVHYPLFEAFDAPDALTPCPVRPVSTHAPQALVMLNSQFTQDTARVFARSLLESSSNDPARITDAFLRCYARKPSGAELRDARRFIGSGNGAELDRWTDFALALINSNEFIYVP